MKKLNKGDVIDFVLVDLGDSRNRAGKGRIINFTYPKVVEVELLERCDCYPAGDTIMVYHDEIKD